MSRDGTLFLIFLVMCHKKCNCCHPCLELRNEPVTSEVQKGNIVLKGPLVALPQMHLRLPI